MPWGRRHSYANPSASTTPNLGGHHHSLLSGLALGGIVLYRSAVVQVSKLSKKIDPICLLWRVIPKPNRIFFRFHLARPHKSKAIMRWYTVSFMRRYMSVYLSLSVPCPSFYTMSPIEYFNIIQMEAYVVIRRWVRP